MVMTIIEIMKVVKQEKIPEDQEQLKEWLKKFLKEFKKDMISVREFYKTVDNWLVDTPVEVKEEVEIYDDTFFYLSPYTLKIHHKQWVF